MIDTSLTILIILAVGVIAFIVLFLVPQRRTKNELGLVPLYEERCTGRKTFGYGFTFGGNIPSWRISLYDNFVVISFPRATSIPYGDIASVEYKQQFLSKGMRIQTHGPALNIVLYPRQPNKIIEILRAKNVQILDR
jgi:hypothetical protein